MSTTAPTDLSQRMSAALAVHRAGRLEQAKGLYEQILADDPGHADALHFLGILTHQRGDSEHALALIGKAIARAPGVATYHNNLATVLEATGRLPAALASYEQAVHLDPADADPHFNAGVVLERLGRAAEAEDRYRAALALKPGDPQCWRNLGRLLEARGALDAAAEVYRGAVEANPGAADAHNRLANALQRLGRLKETISAYRTSLALHRGDARVHNNLGNALHDSGRIDAAIHCYRDAIALEPGFAEAYRNLGRALRTSGERERAVDAFLQALRLNPGFREARRDLATTLRGYDPGAHRPDLAPALAACFAATDVYHQDLARFAASQLKHKHRFEARFSASDGERRALLQDLAGDELFVALLAKTVNVDWELEKLLAGLRRRLLLDSLASAEISGERTGVIAALAQQCFGHEYVLGASPEETVALGSLERRLEARGTDEREPSPELERDVALLSLYRSPGSLALARGWEGVPLVRWSPALRPLIERTVFEPLAEEALRSQLESLGEVEDRTSQAVRAQYEESPYPRWRQVPDAGRVTLAAWLRRRFPPFVPPEFLEGATRVLVPGCGTGQEAIAIARARPDAQVIALDLSEASLAYALRMARELAVANVRFVHGDLLHVSRLGQTFEVIECTGVLHHMEAPVAGWRALTECLRPGGVMRVGLYSERARRVIVAARAHIAARGLTPTPAHIRAFREDVLREGTDGPFFELTESEDFYTLNACRDLVFHAREHRFTLPRIGAAMGDLGLELIGFDQLDPTVRVKYRAEFPDDEPMRDLESWDRFEARHPRTFAGMYRLWCQKAVSVPG